MAPDNPEHLQAQEEDPDLQLIKKYRMTAQWPASLNADHRVKLDDLNCNLLIDQHGAVWIHCPGRGPDVPTLKALYLPLKYRQPVVCNFQQRHPDVPVEDQMQKIQENFCWLGMREGIAEHSKTCNNCQVLQQAKKSPQIPNATVDLNIHGPFVSYGENKFIVILTDEATKITVFKAVKSKTVDSLASTIFSHWICRMAIPQVIDTNLDKKQANDLKAKLEDYLLQEALHNPFIDINRGSCYNQKAADLIAKTVARAELSWEDILPALNLAYNTSNQSSIATSPFQLVYHYAPKLPTTNLKAATTASTFAQERFLTFKRVLETVEKEIIEDKETATEKIAETFQFNQEVMLCEKSFGQQFWSGPGTIIRIK